MEDLINIWNADDELNDDELLDYLRGKSTEEEEHSVEKKMADSSFVNDAVEGLQQFSSTEKVNKYVQQLNEELHNKLTEKNRSKHKTSINLSWQIIAVVVIIVLCVLAYVIIEMMKK